MENLIKPGDVVILKSGGPLITVVGITGESAYCTFFHPNTFELKQEYLFPVFSLSVIK